MIAIGRRLVVDATLAVKWLLPEPLSEAARPLRDRVLLAPDLLVPETTNVLWRHAVRDELSLRELFEALALFDAFGITLLPTRPYMARALDLAQALRHPAYDCFYLAVAEREDAVLVTADGRLIRNLEQDRYKVFRGQAVSLASLS